MNRQNLDLSQTIFALASGSVPSAIAIIKISGQGAFSTIQQIFSQPLRRGREIHFGHLRDKWGKDIDEVLLLSFCAPHSHTGEDIIEIHCHGSPPVVRKIEKTLLELGLRQAQKGEFSYRALLNGKTSAQEVEKLGDVFKAKEEIDLRRIYDRKSDALKQMTALFRERLIRIQAILDTAVDFSEEYSDVAVHAQEVITLAIRDCSLVIQSYERFCDQRVSPRVVIAGRPNAGKSSLFNALLSRQRVLVDKYPGTTRDVIEEDIELGGKLWKIVDTAGFRVGNTETERQGIEFGKDFLSSCQFWLLVIDGTQGVSEEDRKLFRDYEHIPHLIIWNKLDDPRWSEKGTDSIKSKIVRVSALTGEGVSDLFDELKRCVVDKKESLSSILPTATECARLAKVRNELEMLIVELKKRVAPEYLAERSRKILSQLEQVVGGVTTEDVLDRVFSEFCIGK